MKKRVVRLATGALAGVFILAGVIWLLRLTLGDEETLYAGRSLSSWKQQLDSRDAGASNQAYEALGREIIPRLVDQMFHDTNDSRLRLALIETLNRMPGLQVHFTPALRRRLGAVASLGILGPPAKEAVPSLIQALQGPEVELHFSAIQALGAIHSNPERGHSAAHSLPHQ